MAESNLPDAVKEQIDAMREASKKASVQVAVDLEAFTAKNVDAYLLANKLNDIGKITKAIVPFMLSIPKEWGDHTKAETYEKLPILTVKLISQQIAEIINYMTSKN
jgi:hypothetical protein